MRMMVEKTAFRVSGLALVFTLVGAVASSPSEAYAGESGRRGKNEVNSYPTCGSTGVFNYPEWGMVSTRVDSGFGQQVSSMSVKEEWAWRANSVPLWRGDTRAPSDEYKGADGHKETILSNGFTPRGGNLEPLKDYTRSPASDTGHLSTSCDKKVALDFASQKPQGGWVYEINAPGGIDVNATANATDPGVSSYPNEMEVDFPGGIQKNYIKRACQWVSGMEKKCIEFLRK